MERLVSLVGLFAMIGLAWLMSEHKRRINIRVVVGDMGGGFGAKAGARPELIVVAAAARKLGRPVKWIETRSENLVGMTHGRGQVQHVELGATRDGRLVGMRARVVADIGAYPAIAVLLPFLTGQMSAGVYKIPAIDYEAHCVVTNTTPLAAYRGAGRPAWAGRGRSTATGCRRRHSPRRTPGARTGRSHSWPHWHRTGERHHADPT